MRTKLVSAFPIVALGILVFWPAGASSATEQRIPPHMACASLAAPDAHLGAPGFPTLPGPPFLISAAADLTTDTVGQRRFDLGELLAAQFRSPSGSARRAQRRSTRLPPGRAPVGHELMAYPALAGDLRGDDALLKHLHGTHPPLLHRGEVTLWPHSSSSAARPYRELLAGHL